ncbi:MAG: hypothetical protein HC945_03190 [Nitrosarchaeum sp.]|nr:hypothetical protein [Nitrosarchaeum sp.]
MTLHITAQNKQALLGRTLITATLPFQGVTPTRIKIREELAKATKAKLDHIVLRKIDATFAASSVNIEAYIYDDTKHIPGFENTHMIKRNENAVRKSEKPAQDEANA